MRESDKYDIHNPINEEQDCDYCPKCQNPMWDDWNERAVDYCPDCDECQECRELECKCIN